MATPISDELRSLFANEAVQTITITTDILVDNEPLIITNEDIMLGTFSIDRTIMEGSSLNLGSCVASELNMTLNNIDGRFDGINWSGAELSVEVGVEGLTETVPMGVFYIDRTPKSRDTITISALDGMTKFDKLIVDCSLWRFEFETGSLSLQFFVNWCCSQCGVTLATTITGFPNANWSLWMGGFRAYLTTAKNFTCRHLLSWAVAGMGKVAWMNGDGELEIGFPSKTSEWENSAIAGIAIVGKAIVGNTSGQGEITDVFDKSKRFSSDYEDSAIEFTGVSYVDPNTEVTYLTGTASYTLDLTGNIIFDRIQSCDPIYNPEWGSKSVSDMVNNLSELIGITYTPVSMTVIPCPFIELCDWVAYRISEDKQLYALVTNYTFVLNGNNYISAQGELEPDKNVTPSTYGFVQNTIEAMVDYVIEQGTVNGWVYRKWKGGTYECWRTTTHTVNITTQSGGVYYGGISSIPYPITFASVPALVISTTGSSGCWASASNAGLVNETGGIWVYRGASSSGATVILNLYAIGKWR